MITMVAALSLAGCGGSSKPPSVAVTASAASVDGTDAVTLTATVTNDKNSDGVTWSLSGGGALSNTTTTSATYTAPAPASSPQTVTITATSVADTAKTGTATVTVLAKLTVVSTAQNLLGMVGTTYSVQLTSSAGTPPYIWTLAPGSTLPPCLSMNSAGLITSNGPLTASCAIDPNVTFDVTDSGTPNAMSASQTLDLAISAAPAIVFSTTTVPPASGTYKVAYAGSVSASGGAGTLAYNVTSGALPAGLTFSAGAITGAPTAVGTFNFTVTASDLYGDSAAQAYSITVAPATPTLSFAAIASPTFGSAPFTVSASSASSGAVTYAVTSGPATINSSTGLVTLTGAGTVNLSASQAASADYTTATATTSFTVNPETPTLTFAAIPAETFGNPPFTVSASSASSGAVTYSVTSGPATINSSTGLVTLTGTGTVQLSASQAATTNYTAATATASFAVFAEAPTLTFAAIPTETFGNAPFTVSASSASSGAVTYSVTSGPATINSSTGLVTLTGAGTVNLSASQAASGNYGPGTATTSFTVNPGTPTLSFAAIPTETFGNAPFQVSAASASSGAVTYALTAGQTSAGTVTGAGMVTITGVGTIYLTASQAATANYIAATATATVTVNPEVPTLVFAAIPAKTFGNPPFAVSASSASSGAVTYSLTAGQTSAGTVTGAGVVTITGAGTIYLTASQAASGNYAAATATTAVTVNPETPTLTFAAIPTETFGAAPFQASASSASSGAVTYSLTAGQTSAGTVTSAGVVTITGVGTIYLTANQAATANYTAATATTTVTVNPETPALTFASIPAQTYGNPAFQVSASSASSGAVTYSLTPGQTSAGTVTGAGLVTITGAGTIYLTANQAASGNYAAATATTTVTVNGEVPALSFAAIPTHVVGDAPFQVSASSASSGAVTYALTPGQTSAGTVTGAGMVTITGAGTIYLTANQAANGNYAAATATTTVTVNPALSITTTSPLPTGVVGNAYSQQLHASGGIGPYTWTLISNPSVLTPLGLTFTAGNATLAGATPIAGGPVSFTVQVTDSASHQVQGAFSVTINASLTITTTTLSPAFATTTNNYTTTLTALGGSGGDVWSVTVNGAGLGALGLGLNSSTGVLSGQIGTLAAGSATFTVQVKDSSNTTATQQYTINVYSPPALPAPDPGSLPGTVTTGANYNGSINASGGSGNYTWLVTTGLPADGLSASTSGSPLALNITGTPTLVATVTFNVKVTDTTTGLSFTQNGYSIAVNEPTPVTLPSPNPTSLPSGTQGQSYTGAINASGGVGPYTWTINGVTITNQGLVALTDGMSATNNGGNTLSISASTLGSASSVTLTNVVVTDSLNSTASQTYTISTPPPGSQVSGQIFLNSGCGGNVPVVTVGIYTNPGGTLVQSTTTDDSNNNGTGNGNYSFVSVPAGNYTITPSISGPTSLFFPASQSVNLSGSNISGEDFTASLGYTVSGSASYSGAQTGQVYLDLSNNSCGGGSGGLGTSISEATLTATGAYTIRGVPPGSYTLQGRMDNLGEGAQNAINPTGNNSVTVTNANLSGYNVALADPTYSTPTSNPVLNSVAPSSQGVVISFKSSTNSNNVEDANQYVVQWSTSPTLGGGTNGSQFLNVAGSHTFAAIGTKTNIWILDNTVAGAGTFVSGTTYYFQARSFDTLASTTHPSGWSNYGGATPTGVTILTGSVPSGYNTVTGAVSIPAGVTPTGPLYVGFYNQSTNIAYSTEIPLASLSTSSPNNYTVYIPTDTNPDYFNFAILDQNNDGMIDAGDISNTDNNGSSGIAITPTGTLTGYDPVLPTANSTATVTTQYSQSTNPGGGGTNYNLNFDVREGIKLPVSVTLLSGPNVINPIDISNQCNGGCGSDQFQYYASVSNNAPSVGATYAFKVTYSDGTVDNGTVSGKVTAFGSTGAVVGASDLPTNLQPSGTDSSSLQPTFTWTYPANASSYTYQFYICCGSNNDIWDIPGNNSNTNGFTVSEDTGGVFGGTATAGSIPWGEDPSGSGSTPSVGSLTSLTQYNWSIQVQDSNGNSAQTQVYYIPQ
ncbi:MAG: putative Ig domain-containing protein [Terracidiphilus sp.]